MNKIYLASKSPRRQELLKQIGVEFELLSVDVAEVKSPIESAEEFVVRVAVDKASAGWDTADRREDLPVLGADTIVIVEGEILGKPVDKDDAIEMLRQLSGCTHEVYSAIALVQNDEVKTSISKSSVSFREITESEMNAYWESGEPKDKAGAYGMQGYGALFVESLEGSYSGVMGRPLFELGELLGGR